MILYDNYLCLCFLLSEFEYKDFDLIHFLDDIYILNVNFYQYFDNYNL